MVAAMASFILNDALVKYTSQSLPAAQLIFIRGCMACVVVLLAARAMGALPQLRELGQRWVLVRAGADAVATMIYLTAMFNMPLANATAINLAGPLFITLFAACFMGEQVRASRWAAIAVGFLGVLLVIQPKADGFNSYALVCLLGTVFHATRDLLTRRIPIGVPVILITLATTLSIVVLSGAVSLVQGWRPFGWRELALLAVASVLLSSGYYLLVYAMRQGEISLVTPFRYSTLLFAVLIGYSVWGDVPNGLAWCGIALLVGSGLFILQRESARVRKAGMGASALAASPATSSMPLEAPGPVPMDAAPPLGASDTRITRARRVR